jgi:uroporphyrinogen-III synthase
MRKKSKSSTAPPLSNIRVLVGRARHQASALSGELRKRGAEVIEIPFIEIHKPKSFKPLDAALKNLHTYDWLILTSVNGVEAMWERMKKLSREEEKIREGHEFTRAAKSQEYVRASAPEAAAGRYLTTTSGAPFLAFFARSGRRRTE